METGHPLPPPAVKRPYPGGQTCSLETPAAQMIKSAQRTRAVLCSGHSWCAALSLGGQAQPCNLLAQVSDLLTFGPSSLPRQSGSSALWG